MIRQFASAAKDLSTNDLGKWASLSKTMTQWLPKEDRVKIKHLNMELNDSLLVRHVTLESISFAKSQLELPSSKKKFILDGTVGSGKSVALLQSADYFLSKGQIVIYIPRGEVWVSGYEPFDRTEEGEYVQREVTSKVLKGIAKLNGSVLSRVSIKKGNETQSLESILSNVEPKNAHETLDWFLETLQNPNVERPPVIYMIDQFNRWYDRTNYHDAEGKYIPAFDLKLTRSWINLFQQEELVKGAFLSAVDSARHAPVFGHYLNQAKIIGTSQPELQSRIVTEIPVADKEPIPPITSYESKLMMDSFNKKQELIPKNMERIIVPSYETREVKIVLDRLKHQGIIQDDINDNYVKVIKTISGGNPRIVLKDALSYF